ncbi:enoyl-CoA hydratase-related protein [Niallia oryzisoli]|uniref:Enoyl-CoA hydratase-related protein n=1 Tax=Niallia oryzisoli TaxID=1737571 RepID=A0ABZ2CDW8_9BACI
MSIEQTAVKYEYLLVDIENKVATVTINRAPVNALNSQVYQELSRVIDEIDANDDVNVIILTGAGEKAFVAGADINEMAGADLVTVVKNNKVARNMFKKVENSTKPVIAALNGLALGGGLEIALACDLRIASENAKFAFPEVGLGIIPGGGGTQRLQKIVGQGIAKELLFTGTMFSAEQAHNWHIVNNVVPAGEALSAAKELADKLAKQPPVALQMVKLAVNTGSNTDIESGLIIESNSFNTAFATEDGKEGLVAFTEKRKPNYKGK